MPRRTEDLGIRMIEEAIATIEQDGEAAIRVRDICEACSAHEPALYLRFGSRAGLIVAAQAERYRRSIEILVTRSLFALNETIETGDLSTLLKRAVDWGFDPDLRNRLTRINVIGSSVTRPALAEAIGRLCGDPGLARRMGDAARQFHSANRREPAVEKFSKLLREELPAFQRDDVEHRF